MNVDPTIPVTLAELVMTGVEELIVNVTSAVPVPTAFVAVTVEP